METQRFETRKKLVDEGDMIMALQAAILRRIFNQGNEAKVLEKLQRFSKILKDFADTIPPLEQQN